MSTDPWYVVIERLTMELEPMESIVIGPFEKEGAAVQHLESTDVDDWLTGEAKAKGYIADDCYATQNPEIPSYGVNAPVEPAPYPRQGPFPVDVSAWRPRG